MNKKTKGKGSDLQGLGAQLGKIDQQMITLLAERMELSKKVAECKGAQMPILRIQIENGRLEKIKKWAKKNNLNPTFAQAVFYLIIAESCRVQIGQLQSKANNKGLP